MTRGDLLLTVMANLRSARRSLAAKLPAAALTYLGMARHDFGIYIGLTCVGGPWPTPSVDRVRRSIHRIESDLSSEVSRLHAAANQAPADLDALTADVAAGIDVLRTRDGVDLTREQVLERARNVAMGIKGNYLTGARS